MALHLNISRKELLTALTSLQNVTSKKGTIAILSNILIQTGNDMVELTGTDLEVGLRRNVPCEIKSPGSITLPSKKLFEIVRESTADIITLEEKENNWVTISAGSSLYNLAGMPSEEFPAFPDYEKTSLKEFSSEILNDLIDKTLFSVAKEGERQFNLTGVLLEKEKIEENKYVLRMVTSDGHRLSVMEKEIENEFFNLPEEKITLIPKKGIQEIRKFCEGYENISISFEEKQIILKTDDSVLIIRLMKGDFPDYRNIIKIIDEKSFIEVDRVIFLNSIKRMNLFTEERFNIVQLYIKKEKMVLSSQSVDIGNAKDEININFDGEPFNLFFNGIYFGDVLHVLSCNVVKLFISSEKSPCLIKSDEEPGFLSVIMPMKI